MVEYKVVTLKAKGLTRKVDPTELESLLNTHAREGWRAAAITSTSTASDATLLMITLERDLR